ncbi:cysteine hydrolase [Carnobacterium maltaromaticum]|uniref:isochorismatase family protein n=1 Tax=Carnobacterium maltaromaticum TaxID=2751 RepID=UPI000C77943A|nr:isochorismatase family protein [Carnobacterium maltaromaticum]PLS38028.1 cysteine hydrolase [Carnobacterium maltaromaticum]PLS38405.1 cysteine hydrolase [Carnobacterium maltaromaticum]PLS38782.1 cysteine hydrolase [Carnobacterium maltaromaticum]PLS45052.1 cysteine hydrolase [Carnobacterium maltaromaticum]PLS47909.1 cysteine hydrolase [Carnobacterium maltaromaticum]
MADKSHSVLLVVDVQKAFNDVSWGERSNQTAESHIAELITLFRQNEIDVIHIKHLLTKTVNSAFIGTNLEEILHEKGITKIYIVGLTTPHCISTTTRMAANLGFKCYLVEDATASFELIGHTGIKYSANEVQELTIVTLNEEFAEILSTSQVKE